MFKKNRSRMSKNVAFFCILSMLFVEIYPIGVNAQVAGEFVPEGLIGASDIGAAAEASQSKQKGPSVRVAFSSDGGYKNGARVTAVAAPGGFIDGADTSKLYFTWYLKKKGCELNDDIGSNNSCDLDRDGDITENDWKIAAAKIIVRGNYDWQSADYSGSGAGGGVDADPSLGDWDGDNEDEDVDEDIPNCYIQGPTTGKFYELRKVESDFSNSCADGYHRACVRDYDDTTCSVANPDYDPDLIPPDPEIPLLISIDNLRHCQESSGDTAGMRCRIESNLELRDFEGSPYCPNDTDPVCMPNGGTNLAGSSVTNDGVSSNDHAIFGASGTNLCNLLGTNINANVSANPPSYFGLSENATCSSSLSAIEHSAPTCSFIMGINICKHLFAEYTDEIGLAGEDVGDGEFVIAEKRFWGADPNSITTNGKQRDEAAVMGLGVDRITWTYTEGDEIGVAVEGVATTPTSRNDSSYMRTWAFSRGECAALEDMEDEDDPYDGDSEDEDNTAERAFYIKNYDNGEIPMLTADLDLDDCLEDNLLDPRDSDEGLTNMRVDVGVNPKQPTNDPNGNSGDTVIATAAVQHADVENMMYRWVIERSHDGDSVPTDETIWSSITDEFNTHSEFEGVGKRQASFLLNLKENVVGNDDVFYLRVKVTASEQTGNGTNIAKGSVIIKVKQFKNIIGAYSVIPHQDGTLSLNQSDPLCSGDGLSANGSCYVTKNEIVGLRISNEDSSGLSGITWEINGQTYICKESISNDCSDGDTLFFPVLGEPGEGIAVVAKGVNGSGETVEIRKYFIITEQMVGIVSADESSVWKKLLGYRKSTMEPKEADYSDKIFETHMGNTVRLARTGDVTGYNFSWTIDGLARDEYFDQREIFFPVEKMDGESYTISVVPIYDPAQDVLALNKRRALQDHWGITAVNEISIENIESDTIQINVVDTPNVIGTAKGPTLASLVTHLPGQIVFLLEVTLTAFALLIFSGLMFAFMPESISSKKQD